MVLWEYTELFYVTALIFTILAFHKNTERIGRTFYFLAGGILWGMTAWCMLKIDWVWAGSINVIEYTYTPAWEGWAVSIFGFMGMLMIIIGGIRAFSEPAEELLKNI